MSATIKRYCYFPNKRPRVWWWEIIGTDGAVVADGFASKREARKWLEDRGGGA